jgi:RimJ/RimL family protein N-acetyltransferase
MDLIAIAHPAFRHHLVEEARRLNLIYGDQEFVPGERGEYPEHLEARKTTKTGLPLLLRPVKISDEPSLKDFFYSLSDQSMYRRFMTPRRDMPHERLQEFVAIDYTREMVILACLDEGARSPVAGLAEYYVEEDGLTANVAFAVTDRFQNKGVGTELLAHLTQIARKQGLHGFTAEVLRENEAMLRVFEKMKFPIETSTAGDVYRLTISLK